MELEGVQEWGRGGEPPEGWGELVSPPEDEEDEEVPSIPSCLQPLGLVSFCGLRVGSRPSADEGCVEVFVAYSSGIVCWATGRFHAWTLGIQIFPDGSGGPIEDTSMFDHVVRVVSHANPLEPDQ